jgi:hypothetical protein
MAQFAIVATMAPLKAFAVFLPSQKQAATTQPSYPDWLPPVINVPWLPGTVMALYLVVASAL